MVIKLLEPLTNQPRSIIKTIKVFSICYAALKKKSSTKRYNLITDLFIQKPHLHTLGEKI